MAMTPKQMHFARCVAAGMSQAAAYREAFDVQPDSKPATQHEEASRLMRRPEIAARVKALIAARERAVAAAAVSDRERVLTKLRDMMETAEPSDNVRLRAAELLGRTVGLFRDVVETTQGRSAEEIRAEIEERLQALAAEGGDSGTIEDMSEDSDDTVH